MSAPQEGGPAEAPAPAYAASGSVYLGGLDGLRGFGVIVVPLAHFTAYHPPARDGVDAFFFGAPLSLGYLWLDIFFVMSSFLITRSLLESRDDPRGLSKYFVRRVLRIFPLYYAWLALTMYVAPRFEPSLPTYSEGAQLAFWLYAGNAYTGLYGYPHYVLAHLWSLAAEEQFYLVWPFVVRFVSPRALVRVALGVALLSLAFRVVLFANDARDTMYYYFPISRLESFAFGAIMAAVLHERGTLASLRGVGRALGGASVVVLALAIAEAGPLHYEAPGFLRATLQYTGLAGLAAWMVAATVDDTTRRGDGGLRPAAWTRVFEWKPLVLLGRYGYGVYIVHVLVLHVFSVTSVMYRPEVRSMLPWPSLYAQAATMLVATIVLGAVSYHFFEAPILRLRRYFEPVRKPGGGGASTAGS